MNQLNAISLFSSSGIGDLGLKVNGIKTVINCEIEPKRMELFKQNHKESKNFLGDIWKLKDEIIEFYKNNFTSNPFVLMATPPCQGMSSNGVGKLLSDHRKGLRPKLDERNRLIIPTLDIIESLQPEWVILENVPNMQHTIIEDENGELINIIEYIKKRLKNYIGEPKVINAYNFGIPQNRKRLISVFTKSEKGKKYFDKHRTLLPLLNEQINKITLREAIGKLPSLDAKKGKNLDKNNLLHKVPILDEKKYFWVKYTKEGDTAFNNQCIHCGYQENKKHGATIDKKDGINKYNKDTPLYCEKCNSLLPRPTVIDEKTGELRIMKGYTSSYKRMEWDKPSPTLTQNFQFVSSDNKIHPEQNRVLSLYEGMVIQSIDDYNYSFKINGKFVNDTIIRESIGESVPPRLIDLITKNILDISKEK